MTRATRVGQAAAVTLGHLDVGEQVMGEQDRLGRLDVGRAGQHGRALALGQADERALEREECGVERVDRPARPEPQVRGDLVVPRPAGVEPPGERADPVGEGGLDVHVDVLERRVPGDLSPATISPASASRPSTSVATSASVRMPARPRPVDVRDRPAMSSSARAASISIELVNVGHALIGVAAEPPAPGPHRASVRAEGAMLPGAVVSGTSLDGRLDPRQHDRPQPPGRVLGREVPLRLGQQLVADHELAHVRRSSGG